KTANVVGHTIVGRVAGPATVIAGAVGVEAGTEKLNKRKGSNTDTIYFKNGIVVIPKDVDIEIVQSEPIVDSSNIRRSSGNTTSSIKNISGTDKVYSLPNSREVHSSDCTELDNADGLITFPSAKEAKNDGAIPHNCIQ
ncbi:MAG: hypothetical protein ISR98_00005, partial [Parcubacteria group bacterium]|nr:hypothetical protein [Parcubacteria group bacterium]